MPASGGVDEPKIAIIGTGFGGLAAAIELKNAGYEDLVIFERGDEVGGVWRENTYPGAACDVPSPFYSFSFGRNPKWPRRYSAQPDILDYLRRAADTYGVRPHVRFETEVKAADFDETTGRWSVHTTNGDITEVDVLISAVGQLSRPAFPNIKGCNSFTGPMFHSAEWDHDVDLAGKRVAVIGTGASAIQFVPEIQPQVAELTLFQRTPPYVLPRMDTEFSKVHHKIFTRVPATQLIERGGWWGVTEALGSAFLYSKALSATVKRLCRAHLRHQVKDKTLRAKLWPDYPVGCKRILFSSNYLPSLTEPNVEVVTDGIAEITPTGIKTADGATREVDVIILGTGFTASDFLAPMGITGLGGRDLREQWSDSARAYLGVSVPDFPNLFLMYGPNTNLGSGSIVFMLECQARYIRQAITHAQQKQRPIMVRESVAEEFDAGLQERLVDGVWSQCSSWYRNSSGRVSTNWPGLQTEYRKRTASFDETAYEYV
ncbi:NAD(P)/FAD-dependent oxidoreductase [Antrihabitans sp. YC2-6]|uniref:flavin-containing monooxygenase n=1 Tax=Antrihabitans sp. YC2-6 TaxID=2799498 RepID=UPI0027DADDB4|nr:NAD(P)/FAD-dependent oxidoreductase [Antrihabitans sp. YC2-6]